MQPTDRFRILETAHDGLVHITRDNHILPDLFRGVILEAQFTLSKGGSLLWLTEDCPHDEGLAIYLLQPDGTIADTIEASADFTPGILRIESYGETWAVFEFFKNEQRYRLSIEEKTGIHLFPPAGWRYTKRFRSHRLVVSKVT